jgi:hypothetical protein
MEYEYTDLAEFCRQAFGTNPIPNSTEAFRRIIIDLNKAVDEMISEGDYEKAIEYAILMRVVEEDYLTPPRAT